MAVLDTHKEKLIRAINADLTAVFTAQQTTQHGINAFRNLKKTQSVKFGEGGATAPPCAALASLRC